MYYCGIDVSIKSTHICLEDARGRRIREVAVATTAEAIRTLLQRYRAKGLRVAIEAGGQTAWIVDVLRELGAQVHVVHPLKVKWIAESKKKTDRVDAALLAHLLRIGGLPEPVHVPQPRSREVRHLLVARRQLVTMRTRVINVIRGLLRQQQVVLPTRALSTLAGWARLKRVSVSASAQAVVEAYAELATALFAALKALDQQLHARAETDARVAQLETIPGVGPISAQTLLAAVDTIQRFPSAKHLVAYSGLAPSVRASGEQVRYGAITKQGRSEIRAVWVQAAFAALAVKAPAARPLQQWWHRVARRRGKKTAIVALARKLLTIAFHVLRDDTVYQPQRLGAAA